MNKLLLCAALLAIAGCGSAIPFLGDDAGTPDAGVLDAGPRDAGSSDAGPADAGSHDAGSSDAGLADAGSSDAGSSDAGSSDAGAADAGTLDAGTADAGTDAGSFDAGAADAGSGDAGVSDGGLTDAGAHDGGSSDAGSADAGSQDAGSTDAGSTDAGAGDAGPDGGVVTIGTTPVLLATALVADEFVLAFHGVSASHTSWAQTGNEALVLEIRGPQKALIANVVMHQGADGLSYQTQLGKLAAGDSVYVDVSSTLSASAATLQAKLSAITLTAVATLADKEGVYNAPIIKWPMQKRFDDLPVLLGWSKSKQHYELYYTDENGGTAEICGGGALGMQSEIGRWGRGSDDEGIFNYGGTDKTWERCNATSEPYSTLTPQQENLHPILYYGDGHNRLFESRGGYGQTCGTSADAEANGALTGWNSNNPGNDPSLDGPYVIVMRLVPVDLDSLGFASSYGRREGALDHYAPWMYRVTDSELTREGKIDQKDTFNVEDYLFIDVQANDVDGSGDNFCSSAQGGFKLRAHTANDGVTHDSIQMTQDYFTGAPGTAWKRMAIALGSEYTPAQLDTLVFDAYDSDGIFFLSEGDAFMVRPAGDNGATLEYLHQGNKAINVYVDDNSSGCVNGTNSTGPASGYAYPCAGTAYSFPP